MAPPFRVGFHASHEQFPPSELLALAREAEAAGFDCAMSSDHFRPWARRRGTRASPGPGSARRWRRRACPSA